MPDIPGMFSSRRIASKGSCSRRERASVPLGTPVRLYPFFSKKRKSGFRSSISSSIQSILCTFAIRCICFVRMLYFLLFSVPSLYKDTINSVEKAVVKVSIRIKIYLLGALFRLFGGRKYRKIFLKSSERFSEKFRYFSPNLQELLREGNYPLSPKDKKCPYAEMRLLTFATVSNSM